MDIIEQLEDLYKQAITEHSHYYVASVVSRAAMEISALRSELKVTRNLLSQHIDELGSKKYIGKQ